MLQKDDNSSKYHEGRKEEGECIFRQYGFKKGLGTYKDYVKGMWLMLQKINSYLFVAKKHITRDFVEKAFKHVGKNIVWEGEGK